MHGLFLGAALAALLLGDHAANKPEIWRECRLYRDLCYGSRPDEKGKRSGQFLDLIMPADGVKAETPVYVHVHGGSWCQQYNKDDENLYLLTSIARSGWLVVNANYCLADEREAALGKLSVTFDDMLADIDAVLGFLRDRHPLPVAMVYAQVPPADLLHPRFKEAQPYFRLLAKGDVRRYSPVELVRRGTPPAVVASMGCDELVPAENFHRLTNAYHLAGVEVSASLTPGCGHGDMPRGLEADVVRRINRMALRTGLLRKSEVECRSGRTMNARSCR